MTLLTDVKTRWDRVAQRLRAELGEDLYTSWFARMEAEDIDSGRLTVSVPTRFLKSWIETHYLSKLQKIGEAELGPARFRPCARAQRGGVRGQARGGRRPGGSGPARAPAPQPRR